MKPMRRGSSRARRLRGARFFAAAMAMVGEIFAMVATAKQTSLSATAAQCIDARLAASRSRPPAGYRSSRVRITRVEAPQPAVAAVRTAFARNLRVLRDCADHAAPTPGMTGGVFTVRFTLDREGRIGPSSPSASSTVVDRLAACVMQQVRTWAFGRAAGAAGGEVAVTLDATFERLPDGWRRCDSRPP